jgi:hypothetical protein
MYLSTQLFPKKKKERGVMKHKCPCTKQILNVAIIVKTQGQGVKIQGINIKVLSQRIIK